jgi:5-methylcytosine-specific restriction endonuclease McrA
MIGTAMNNSTDAALLARCRAALAKHRRRARADRQRLDYTAEDLLALARRSPTCPYCRCVIHPGVLAFDHRTPPTRSGRHALDNLLACCGTCNEAKGLMTEAEYKELLALLRTWHPRAGADVLGRLRSGGRRYRRR